jgi:catalase-peroxidase
MGPHRLYLGSEVPAEELIWQDPIPTPEGPTINDADIKTLKAAVLKTDLSIAQLVSTAWASASTFRGTDKRGGANGGRVRLLPQRDWDVNQPDQLARVLKTLEKVKEDFNTKGGNQVSMADLIVLAGCAGVEAAAKAAGHQINVPFTPGRGDATQEQTDVESFDVMEPAVDGFRNYQKIEFSVSTEELLLDRAHLLNLTAPEMTVLVGGLRVLGANHGDSTHGVFTANPGQLSNDFFINLIDLNLSWTAIDKTGQVFEGCDRKSGKAKWKGTRADLIFGSNSELRAIAEVYAADDAKEKFVTDFVSAWVKVMELDRFDLSPDYS